jgi:SAM-dependent methyltransferase
MDEVKRRQLEAEYERPDHWNYKSDPYEIHKYERTLAILPDGHYASALEIGCSEGVFTRRLAPLADEVLGLDVVPLAIERARAECGGLANVHFREFDINTDTLESQFDLIFCAEVLYYLRWTRLRPITRKVVSWLRRGGYLVAVHTTNSIAEEWGFGPKGAELTHRLFERPGIRRVADNAYEGYVVSLFRKEADVRASTWREQAEDLVGLDYVALARTAICRVIARTSRWRGA